MTSEVNKPYVNVLKELKERIRQARQRTSSAVNKELLQIYWEIGQAILTQQHQHGWGAKIIDQLANDLRGEFQDMKGLSTRNLKYMRTFAEAYPHFPHLEPFPATTEIVQAPLAQLKKQSKPHLCKPRLHKLVGTIISRY